MNDGKNIVHSTCKNHTNRTEKDLYRVCPSKLNKRDLEDLYFTLLENNVQLKKTINDQQDQIRLLSTKVQRLTTLKIPVGARNKECCSSSKVLMNEQKELIAELKKTNEQLSERIRLLNMRLCSAKQFLRRSSAQSSRCPKCLLPSNTSIRNLSTSALYTKRSDANLRTEATSYEYLDKANVPTKLMEIVSTQTENASLDEDEHCHKNKCQTIIEEMKKKIAHLEEELSVTHKQYTERLNEVEQRMSSLRAENVRVRAEHSSGEKLLQLREEYTAALREQLRTAEERADDLGNQLMLEKGRLSEIEMQLKVEELSTQLARTLEKQIKTPQPYVQNNSTSTVSYNGSPDKVKYSDDSGYTEMNRSQSNKRVPSSPMHNHNVLDRIDNLQAQLDTLKLSLKDENGKIKNDLSDSLQLMKSDDDYRGMVAGSSLSNDIFSSRVKSLGSEDPVNSGSGVNDNGTVSTEDVKDPNKPFDRNDEKTFPISSINVDPTMTENKRLRIHSIDDSNGTQVVIDASTDKNCEPNTSKANDESNENAPKIFFNDTGYITERKSTYKLNREASCDEIKNDVKDASKNDTKNSSPNTDIDVEAKTERCKRRIHYENDVGLEPYYDRLKVDNEKNRSKSMKDRPGRNNAKNETRRSSILSGIKPSEIDEMNMFGGRDDDSAVVDPRTYSVGAQTPVPMAASSPRTHSSPDTEGEISSLSDLPNESDDKRVVEEFSPGEERSYDTQSVECSALSDGELPQPAVRRLSYGEDIIKNKKPVYSRESAAKMEDALRAIGEELTRCRLLLQGGAERLTYKDVSSMTEDDPLFLRRAPAQSQIAGSYSPKCIFTLHIGTLVLSDQAMIASRGKTLALSWQFYDHSSTMTRLPVSRVIDFDVSTEYDVLLTDHFLNYMKNEEMPINICELDKPDSAFATCALPLRDAVIHADRRVDMSLALVGTEAAQNTQSTGIELEEAGVLDLWCTLKVSVPLPLFKNTHTSPTIVDQIINEEASTDYRFPHDIPRQNSFLLKKTDSSNIYDTMKCKSWIRRNSSQKQENGRKKSVTIAPKDSFEKINKRKHQGEENTQHVDITVQWLSLEECEARRDPRVCRLYVAYSFLGHGGAELETPTSLPKPTNSQEKCHFGFKKRFSINDCDLPLLCHLARCRESSSGPPDPKSCIVFSIISEPAEDPLGIETCEDIGFAFLYLGDVVSASGGAAQYTAELRVRGAGRCPATGSLAIRLSGLNLLRRCNALPVT